MMYVEQQLVIALLNETGDSDLADRLERCAAHGTKSDGAMCAALAWQAVTGGIGSGVARWRGSVRGHRCPTPSMT
jgi:hypothetical protein